MIDQSEGPFALLDVNPRLANNFRALGAYFREHSPLSPALRELAILATARSWDSSYVWSKHASRARSLPLTPGLVDAVAEGNTNVSQSESEGIVLALCCALRRSAGVTPQMWRQAESHLGAASAVDLTAVIGIYRCVVALAETAESARAKR